MVLEPRAAEATRATGACLWSTSQPEKGIPPLPVCHQHLLLTKLNVGQAALEKHLQSIMDGIVHPTNSCVEVLTLSFSEGDFIWSFGL